MNTFSYFQEVAFSWKPGLIHCLELMISSPSGTRAYRKPGLIFGHFCHVNGRKNKPGSIQMFYRWFLADLQRFSAFPQRHRIQRSVSIERILGSCGDLAALWLGITSSRVVFLSLGWCKREAAWFANILLQFYMTKMKNKHSVEAMRKQLYCSPRNVY